MVENQIAPHIGAKALQKLTRLDIEGWHNTLHQGGLAPRTIGHAHRVLSKALSDAESDGMVVRNVCKLRKAPKVAESEMAIVQDVPGLVAKLRGSRLCVPAMVALFTGMRLGEVLALRWGRVDLDSKVIEVREALEPTKAGIRFKVPKSKAGRRDITLPDLLVETLREHRRAALEVPHASSAQDACPTMRCCSPTLTGIRSTRATYRQTGASLPGASVCRR